MTLQDVRQDCFFFRSTIPCKPNKKDGSVCGSCTHYRPISRRVLIIKLGAMGDVIRTTPLARRLKDEDPNTHITWVTLTPEIVSSTVADEILPFTFEAVYGILHRRFDIAINLDKEIEACALLADAKAEQKYGFTWDGNSILPATPAAEHKLITGFFDGESQKNTKNYLEEIFEICHRDFRGEEYTLDVDAGLAAKWSHLHTLAAGKPIIGLNTGCGKRWTTRLWQPESWVELILKLQSAGYFPILLGGPDEHELNVYYNRQTNAYYPGTMPLKEFIALFSHLDVTVTQVSMAMHIALGLRTHLVLMNNIFNKHEFELYGRGSLVGPSSGCDCFYGTSCSRQRHCMLDLGVDTVLDAIISAAEQRRAS